MQSGTEIFSGINVRASRTDIVDSQLARSINADLHETVGTLRLRNGRAAQFSPALSSTPYSLFRNGVSATRYRAADTTFYRSQTGITDYRNLPLSGDSRTGFVPYKPLNDSTTWTFAADLGVMQKDDGTVCRRWGLQVPNDIKMKEDDSTATLIYSYEFGLTHIRYDGSSVAHESNPIGSNIGLDRDTAGDDLTKKTSRKKKRRIAGRRTMYLQAGGPGLCKLGLVELWVTDGVPPYSWIVENGEIGDLAIRVFGDNNERAIITFVGNTGSGVAGIAYSQYANSILCASSGGYNCGVVCNSPDTYRVSQTQNQVADRGCNLQLISSNSNFGCPAAASTTLCSSTGVCTPVLRNMGGAAISGVLEVPNAPTYTQDDASVGALIDVRTQAMKDAGCHPCIIVQATNPAVVTAIDSVGQSLSAIIIS